MVADIFNNECKFMLGANSISDLPSLKIPEFAFIGRSNVGKSTLINCITGHKAIARVSKTPGRTRQLNFFNLASKLILVDLPGYGYAKASKKEIEHWNELIAVYLANRKNLKRIYVLIDARRGIKDIDQQMLHFFNDNAASIQIILTKSDKINRENLTQLIAETKQIIDKFTICYNNIIITSGVKKIGINDLRCSIKSALY